MTTETTSTRSKYLKWGIIGGVILLVLIVFFSILGAVNAIRNTGIQKEQALMQQYSDNKNQLSTYTNQFNESLGIAGASAASVDKILSDAVQGRYDGNLQPGTSGSLFSAIQEAYPDLTATAASYSKVQDLVVSGRADYRDDQSKLLDMVRDYNTWRKSGIFQHIVVDALGYPSDDLTVTDGDTTYTGKAALTRISRVILSQDAINSYNSGTTGPLITPNAPATPSN